MLHESELWVTNVQLQQIHMQLRIGKIIVQVFPEEFASKATEESQAKNQPIITWDPHKRYGFWCW